MKRIQGVQISEVAQCSGDDFPRLYQCVNMCAYVCIYLSAVVVFSLITSRRLVIGS